VHQLQGLEVEQSADDFPCDPHHLFGRENKLGRVFHEVFQVLRAELHADVGGVPVGDAENVDQVFVGAVEEVGEDGRRGVLLLVDLDRHSFGHFLVDQGHIKDRGVVREGQQRGAF
jgi:hypothetical protein